MPGNRKKVHWGEEESLKRARISALASSGEEKRRSIEMIVYDAYASQARSSHVARVAHAPPVRGLFFFFFLLTRFLNAHAMNTKTQMKKNEPSGLLFTSSLLAKSGLKVTPLCREGTRCKHRYRARAPSRLLATFDSGIGSTSPGRAPRPSH